MKKLSDIKPPLVIVCAAIDSKFNMSKRVGKSEIRALSDSRLILLHLIILCTTDYGHTMAKSLILCGPNSHPNPK